MDEWISKKDLLKETGISYGQLYRWKREKLIPDTWFDKRSSFTGQETYFPRTLILERVYFILTHKDDHSLLELKNLLSPESVSRSYSLRAISALPGASRSALLYEALQQSTILNHGQALVVVICANYDSACHPDDAALISLMTALDRWQQDRRIFEKSEGRLSVLRKESLTIPLFYTGGGELITPEGFREEYTLTVNEISRTYTRMLNTIYEEK